jgi:hypothetical protein
LDAKAALKAAGLAGRIMLESGGETYRGRNGLYRTMLYIVQGQYSTSAQTEAHTLLGIFAIALAVTVSTPVFTDLGAHLARRTPRGRREAQD